MYEISKEAYDLLIEQILSIIVSKGLKATTMDGIAAALSMSKRTLYEIFGSKEEMIISAIKHQQNINHKKIEFIFKDSKNVMEAMLRVLDEHQKNMKNINAKFFRDMSSDFKPVRELFDSQAKMRSEKTLMAIDLGIKQGVFRNDVNYPIALHMVRIQMESLKRFEEFFPPEITLMDAYDTITIGFLRSIASPKGMEILDSLLIEFKKKRGDETLNNTNPE